MSAVSSALTTLSLTGHTLSFYEFGVFGITFILLMGCICHIVRFLVLLGEFIYERVKERGGSND